MKQWQNLMPYYYLVDHDVSPLNYGEEPLQGLGDVFPERDQFDFALLKAAEEKQIPIFCICRGIQILNVYRGGSLYQDLKYDENCTIKTFTKPNTISWHSYSRY